MRVLQGAEWNRQCYDSDWLNHLASEAIGGFRWLFEMLLVIAHFLEGRQEKNSYLAAIVNMDFGNIPSIDVDGENHGVGMEEWS
jgi:hypothetical protein